MLSFGDLLINVKFIGFKPLRQFEQFTINCIHHKRKMIMRKKRLVSSAIKIKLRILETLQIIFIYNKKKIGPRIDPWGTPHLISVEDD